MGSTHLRDAINELAAWAEHTPQRELGPSQATKLFGSLTFNDEVQRSRLPKEVYRALRRTIVEGEPMDPGVADTIATAMKDWAVENGATHYTHWFLPMTGITAEKHDSFLSPGADRKSVV